MIDKSYLLLFFLVSFAFPFLECDFQAYRAAAKTPAFWPFFPQMAANFARFVFKNTA